MDIRVSNLSGEIAMRQIEIDFDVFKELTGRLENETDDYNAVLRRVLEIKTPAPGKGATAKVAGKTWVSKGVSFDHETQFRATYKGQEYRAVVNDGRLMINEHGASSSLSHAARLVTNTSVDGWVFWEVKRPTDSRWRKAGELRR